ncbi:MAG: hypothetical protein GWO87_03420 [Xanthomonadaceae bacterium]|nr:hypothetical protein [Rhodospirillaceae bacterium]NIA18211.1 hypothetical protein [Xanthomonadaceae bacterium]
MIFLNKLKNRLNSKIKKIAFYSFIIALLIILFILFLFYPRDMSKGKAPIYGLNFSQKYATDLGLDWQKTYLAIINELKPKRLRISTQWDLIEQKQGKFYFSDIDWQLKKAREKNIKIILAIGRRTPRWPECHTPVWAKNFSEKKQQLLVLNLLKKEINHFKKYNNIIYWQLENEPLLNLFGKCPKGDKKFLDQEIILSKSLTKKPIVLTDSGELSSWMSLSKRCDILGTSMYRTVWNKYWGFSTYPFPPAFYYYKAKINHFFHKNLQKVIITELQGEAWSNNPLNTIPLNKQYRSMNLKKFKNIIIYARKSGFSEIYIWGAEWWYWLKQNNDNSFWKEAQNVLK